MVKDSPYIIELLGETTFSKATTNSSGFVRYPFQFVQFEEVKATNGEFFIDVLGFVTSVGKAEIKSTNAQAVEFCLTGSGGHQVQVTFWGEIGDQLLARRAV